jgi:hypothetical protein
MADAADPATPAVPADTSTAAEVAAKVTTTRVQQEDPPIDRMPRVGVVLLTLYFLLFGAISVHVMVSFWPPPETAAQTETTKPGDTGAAASPATPASSAPGPAACPGGRACADSVVALGGLLQMDLTGRGELRLIMIALFAGGLGAVISSGLSFASYLGSRRLDRWWTVWYLMRPPVGMALALITYFLLRAGLLSPGASVNQVSPYGVAAIGGLMGMFIKEATDKLKDVAAALFKSNENEQRAQPLAGEKQTEMAKGSAEVTTSPVTGDTSTTSANAQRRSDSAA